MIKSKMKKIMEKNAVSIKNELLTHQVIMPEPEPISFAGDVTVYALLNTSNSFIELRKINGSWATMMQCKQLPPHFASCPAEVE